MRWSLVSYSTPFCAPSRPRTEAAPLYRLDHALSNFRYTGRSHRVHPAMHEARQGSSSTYAATILTLVSFWAMSLSPWRVAGQTLPDTISIPLAAPNNVTATGLPLDRIAKHQLSQMAALGLLKTASGAQNSSGLSRRHRNNTATAPAPGQPQQAQERVNISSATQLIQRAACAAAPTLRRQEACRVHHGLGVDEPVGMAFKDRQTQVPSRKWEEMQTALLQHQTTTATLRTSLPTTSGGGSTTGDVVRPLDTLDPWLAEELEPYLYDMDYLLPDEVAGGNTSTHSHLWDPELRLSGAMHCADPQECLTPYLPELYYVGDDDLYMGGWALNGFSGTGLRSAIGPNIAPGDDRRNYNYTYIPYTQRILFAPAASLFFPYLFSIYAGDVYVAEVDPMLTVIARAARAGIVEDYYYVNNYYTSYSFITWGVGSAAVLAATARARGVIGTSIKLRNFNALLASVSRDDYNERNRILLLNGINFIGVSGGGYLFSNPIARNAFVGQNPITQIPYYAYDYAGATNPFPLQPATGK